MFYFRFKVVVLRLRPRILRARATSMNIDVRLQVAIPLGGERQLKKIIRVAQPEFTTRSRLQVTLQECFGGHTTPSFPVRLLGSIQPEPYRRVPTVSAPSVEFRRKRVPTACFNDGMTTRVRASCWRPTIRRSTLAARVRAEARVVRGPAYVVQDNIDTDQIIPAEYLTLVPTKVRARTSSMRRRRPKCRPSCLTPVDWQLESGGGMERQGNDERTRFEPQPPFGSKATKNAYGGCV